MKLTKLFGWSYLWIQILLIYFVTPSYQLVNENTNGVNKVLTKKLNQIPTKNIGRLVRPVTARKLPVKASPIQITPQPLLPRRKVQLNPTEFVKLHGLINNNKTPNSVKVDEPKPKHSLVENKGDFNVNSQKNRKHDEKSTFTEETEDVSYKIEKSKEDEPNIVPDCKNETKGGISKTTTKADETGHEPAIREVVANKDLETQKLEETEEIDDNVEDELNDDDDVPMDIHEEYKVRSSKPKSSSSSYDISLPDKKKVLKITDVPLKVNNHVEPKKDSVESHKFENSVNQIICEAKTPRLTKVEINVSPKVMEKLTNDANDKIFINKFNFEELQEKYDPDSCANDKNEPNDSPFAPDTTFVKEPYKYPSEENIDKDEICENSTTNSRFPNVANKALRERIWRAWKNSEIHIRSDNNIKNKRKEAVKNKPNINWFDAKRYNNHYSNVKFNPVNEACASKSDHYIKPNNVEEVICVEGNIEVDPVNYGMAENLNDVPDVRYVDDFSSVKIAPVDNTYNAVQSNILTNIDDVSRFSDYNIAFRPFGYGAYKPRAYPDIRPRKFENQYNFSGFGNFRPFKYEPYNVMPQRNIWHGMAPAKAGIRYYAPNEYFIPRIPNCYYPQSFGTQYAPVSRYQKYLFPCM